jgi:hypothetical protein
MYSEGVPAVQAVLRGKLTSRGGTERDWTRGTTLSHLGNACSAAGAWRYHQYPLSHPKRRES